MSKKIEILIENVCKYTGFYLIVLTDISKIIMGKIKKLYNNNPPLSVVP